MRLLVCAAMGAAILVSASQSRGDLIALINPGGEAYTGTTTVNIVRGGAAAPQPTIATTGWDSTYATDANHGGQSFTNLPFAGTRRLSVGTGGAGTVALTTAAAGFVGTSATTTAPNAFRDTVILFQGTSRVIAEGDSITLGFQGRGAANFATDNTLNALFGIAGGSGTTTTFQTVVTIPTTLTGTGSLATSAWVGLTINHVVGPGSPLIGQPLAIGFNVTGAGAAENGGFAALDDVTLNVTSVPEASAVACFALVTTAFGLVAARRSLRKS